jgi:hypothetical protein
LESGQSGRTVGAAIWFAQTLRGALKDQCVVRHWRQVVEIVLRPSQDRITAPGDVITTSDQKDNQQWMVAQQDRSMTFDVGVVDLPASYRYAMKALN